MKRIIGFLAVAMGIGLVGCEPMDDVYDELGPQEQVISSDVTYTLTDDDYDDLGLEYGDFGSEDEAKELLPAFLNDKYPALGKGSSALITYKLYHSVPTEKSFMTYTVTEEDYLDQGLTYKNFDKLEQISTFLDAKFPDVADRTLVVLTYVYYNGITQTLTNGFLKSNGEWVFAEGFTDDEYILMGEPRRNFSSKDVAMEKIALRLPDKYKYAPKEEGEIVPITYKLYTKDVSDIDGDENTDESLTYSKVGYFIFLNGVFEAYNNILETSMQFGHDGSTWVPDNTIKYTLGVDDYVAIGNAFASQYADAASSAGNYKNFDRRAGNAAFWSDDMLVEAFNVLLDDIAPGAAEGQKYVVTFDIYNGSAGTESLSLIKEGGVWVLNQ